MISTSLRARRATLFALLASLGVLQPTLPARADQSDQIVFDVVLKGIRAGELVINGKIVGTSYGANGVLQTAGLIGLLRKIRHDATVSGGYRNGRFTPMRFSEKSDTPRGKSTHEIVYKNGTPIAVSQVPPRKPRDTDVDPAKQGGTIDPLTALYAVLRDVDRDQACQLDVKMYDGAKRSQVRLFDPRPEGKGVVCSGEYRRLAGFSAKDMAEKSRFAFTLHYDPTTNGRLQVDEIETDTIYGKGRLKRQ